MEIGRSSKMCTGKAGFLNLGILDILGQMLFVVGTVLCIIGCLAVSLATTHQMPVAPFPNYKRQKRLQSLPNVSSGFKVHP